MDHSRIGKRWYEHDSTTHERAPRFDVFSEYLPQHSLPRRTLRDPSFHTIHSILRSFNSWHLKLNPIESPSRVRIDATSILLLIPMRHVIEPGSKAAWRISVYQELHLLLLTSKILVSMVTET
ncbi:hypothetical protein WAI453_002250 [Rhynchosporium graminicola]